MSERTTRTGGNNGSWVDWEPSEPIHSPPPSSTLDWVEDELRSAVIDVLALPGGLSSAVHRLELLDGRSVVMRRYVLADWLEREPHIPAYETTVLGLLPSLDLPAITPSLVVADLRAARTDVPTIVMSEVPGRPDLAPIDAGGWADALAESLAGIHATELTGPVADLAAWRRWDEAERPIPTWTSDPDLWQQAKELRPGELPVERPTFLHRDFHPANIHWNGDRIVGVVDWIGACIGEPAADVAHCRWNLAVLRDPEVAEWFTSTYRELTGYDADLLDHDLSVVLSAPVGPFPTFAWNALGRADLTPEVVADRIDAWLAHLLDA